ncbi:hypothetical protein IWW34DRAFT_911370 [Fusarium oxysporum f. sp. albedinis]|nr:hypothetical protein FocnCong_v020054 [Fusarium oxysporum f. sp. conglutinans]KAI3564224.1 hypothetical protein IWW34DRAFT_911370 [Fusarium oxysporum f. sp. albedinis]KAI8416310.1 hypothetical protein FOFC_02619 [Fusarium oxysporum]KAJ0126695.1 Uncharacterized protein HZ326_30199 [Fusarium oxysporum f. sp. albedinis]KAK2468410.1 hypothetical protein H9L39_20056 [Fusarium oxysporum f. sp. albedinis]
MQNDQNIYQFDFADNPEQQQQDDIAALLGPPDDMSQNSIAVSDTLHNTLMVSPFQFSAPPAPASQTAHIQHDCECTRFSDWSSEELLAPFKSPGSGSSHAVQFDRALTPKPMISSLDIPISSAALQPIFPHPSGNARQYTVQTIAPAVTRMSNLASIAGTPALLYPTIWKPVKFTIDSRRKAHVHATVEQDERNHRHSISHPSLP